MNSSRYEPFTPRAAYPSPIPPPPPPPPSLRTGIASAPNAQIPLPFFLLQVATPFQCFVPYELFTLQIAETAWMADPVASLHSSAVRLSPWQRKRMRDLIAHFRLDLLWNVEGSRCEPAVLKLTGSTFANAPYWLHLTSSLSYWLSLLLALSLTGSLSY